MIIAYRDINATSVERMIKLITRTGHLNGVNISHQFRGNCTGCSLHAVSTSCLPPRCTNHYTAWHYHVSKVNTDIVVRNPNFHTATGNHMPYGITQCYLPHGRGTFPPLPQPKLVLDLATPDGCKAELTQVVVTSQYSLPAKYGHLSQK